MIMPSFLPSTRKNVFLPSHKVPSARCYCITKHRKFSCLLGFHSTGNVMSGKEQEEKLRAHLLNKTYLSKHTARPMHQLISKDKSLFCKKQRVEKHPKGTCENARVRRKRRKLKTLRVLLRP